MWGALKKAYAPPSCSKGRGLHTCANKLGASLSMRNRCQACPLEKKANAILQAGATHKLEVWAFCQLSDTCVTQTHTHKKGGIHLWLSCAVLLLSA